MDLQTENKKTSQPTEEKESAGKSFFEFVEMLVIAIAAILLFFSFVLRQAVVDGDSMQNTLQNGERLLVSDLFYTPKTGDIIVFQSSATGKGYPLVKRVIATEGDTVRLEKNGLYVNNTLLDEPYVFTDNFYYTYSGSHRYIKLSTTYTVPEGELFVMGDHRNNSLDSRDFGFIAEADILGRVLVRLTPLSRFGFIE